LDYENYYNPYEERRKAIGAWRAIAKVDVNESSDIIELGKQLMSKGIKKKDALHIACAVEANCDYFLTTDKKLLANNFEKIKTVNPLDFIKTLED
jgi:predicted nucleic acid-binding protein